MAQLVAAGARQLDGADVRLKDIASADHTDLEWCDGIALGSPTNYDSVCWQMKQWWDEQPLENWGKRDGTITTYDRLVHQVIFSWRLRRDLELRSTRKSCSVTWIERLSKLRLPRKAL